VAKPSPETAASFSVEVRTPVLEELEESLSTLFAHWLAIKGDHFAPTWRDFDWQQVPTTLIPWCAVADVKYDPVDFVYRYWGTARSRGQGEDFTGKSVSEFRPTSIADKAIKEYEQVVRDKAPILVITSGQTKEVYTPFSYQFLRLPFSYDGEKVDNVLGVGLYDNESKDHVAEFYGIKKKTGQLVKPRPIES